MGFQILAVISLGYGSTGTFHGEQYITIKVETDCSSEFFYYRNENLGNSAWEKGWIQCQNKKMNDCKVYANMHH